LDFTQQIPPIPPDFIREFEIQMTTDGDGNVSVNGKVGDVSAGISNNLHLTLGVGKLHLDVASGGFSGSYSQDF